MSHPKQVRLFVPWAKAMVAGATVDRPDYGKKMTKRSAKSRRRRRKSHGIRRRKIHNA